MPPPAQLKQSNQKKSCKIAIIIPAFNEEDSVGRVVSGCMKKLEEYEYVKVIVIDDGSRDQTSIVAKEAGAEVIKHRRNQGVARAIQTGIDVALKDDPKIIVQLDADGQHDAAEVPILIDPILKGDADMVIGRRIYEDWSPPISKKVGNWLLTRVANQLAGTNLKDAQSGFRAMSREVASNLKLRSRNTYVHEMIIKASRQGFRVNQVDTKVLERRSGKSKVVNSIASYAWGAGITIIRVYRDFEPLKFFGGIGALLILFGFALGTWLLIGPPQWLIEIVGFRTIFLLITVGIQITLFGFLADMIKQE